MNFQSIARRMAQAALSATLAMCSVSVLTSSCNQRNEAVDRIVKELNSPAFKAKEVATGLFTDSSATLEGDTLALTFYCQPAIDLTAITADKLPVLRESAIEEFRTNLSDSAFREGIEAMGSNNMTMKLTWQYVNGKTINVELPPDEILKNE